MRYLLLIYGNEGNWNEILPEEQGKMMREYNDYGAWLRDKGWNLGGEALEPVAQATTVQVRDGKTLTTDGPFAETKEQLGGYYAIQCDNLDEAIEAASKIPGARDGKIEIRPIAEFPEQPEDGAS